MTRVINLLLALWLPSAILVGAAPETSVPTGVSAEVASIGSVPLRAHQQVTENAEEIRDSEESRDSDDLQASSRNLGRDASLDDAQLNRAPQVEWPSLERRAVLARGPPA